jgi:hypothetical protein
MRSALCSEETCEYAEVDPVWNRFDQRNDEEKAWPVTRLTFAESRDDCLIPLICNLNRGRVDGDCQDWDHKDTYGSNIV